MERSFPALLGVIAVVVTACDAPSTPAASEAPVADGRAATPAQQGAVRPSAKALRPSVAERLVEKSVVWPAASDVDATARARFAAAEVAKIDVSGVPVLAPSRGLERAAGVAVGAAFARATVVAKPDWFTLSIADADFEAARGVPRAPTDKGVGLTVFVQGSRLAKRVDHVPPVVGRQTLRGRPAWITQNEHVWHATWEENGASYVVEVECGSFDDPRCADDAYLREVAESLVFVGGRGAEGGAR